LIQALARRQLEHLLGELAFLILQLVPLVGDIVFGEIRRAVDQPLDATKHFI
jgi:hypothetical protein